MYLKDGWAVFLRGFVVIVIIKLNFISLGKLNLCPRLKGQTEHSMAVLEVTRGTTSPPCLQASAPSELDAILKMCWQTQIPASGTTWCTWCWRSGSLLGFDVKQGPLTRNSSMWVRRESPVWQVTCAWNRLISTAVGGAPSECAVMKYNFKPLLSVGIKDLEPTLDFTLNLPFPYTTLFYVIVLPGK